MRQTWWLSNIRRLFFCSARSLVTYVYTSEASHPPPRGVTLITRAIFDYDSTTVPDPIRWMSALASSSLSPTVGASLCVL